MKNIVDINWLFFKYYKNHPELRRIIATHSECVARKALQICRDKNLKLDHKDVYCAAMLHDIGVIMCNAPAIHAPGQFPYICHGIEGKKLLEHHGLKKFAGVCANHTGAGLSAREIIKKGLPLPPKDLIPKTLLEKLICYADKFYSKGSDLSKEKTLDEVLAQMEKFGPDSYKRFLQLHQLFGNPDS